MKALEVSLRVEELGGLRTKMKVTHTVYGATVVWVGSFTSHVASAIALSKDDPTLTNDFCTSTSFTEGISKFIPEGCTEEESIASIFISRIDRT